MKPREHMDLTLDFVNQALGLPKLTEEQKQVCSLQAACIEAMGELEQGHTKEAHQTLKDALLEAI